MVGEGRLRNFTRSLHRERNGAWTVIDFRHGYRGDWPGDSVTIEALTYNVWQKRNVEYLAAVIRESDAGIVSLQESWGNDNQINDELGDVLGFDVLYGGRDTPNAEPPGDTPSHWINDHYMPTVLLTKYEVVDYEYYNASSEPGAPNTDAVRVVRSVVRARLRVSPDLVISVVTVHLNPWQEDERLREIQELVAQVEMYSPQDPTIILGDYNPQPEDEAGMVPERGNGPTTDWLGQNGFIDTYRAVYPDITTHPGITYEGEGRIDHVFVRTNITPVDAIVSKDGVFGADGSFSDHYAMFAQLEASSN